MYTFATRSFVTDFNGARVAVKKDEVWAADDPFVKRHPDAFGEPSKIRRTTPAPRVETAAQPPGRSRLGRPAAKTVDL